MLQLMSSILANNIRRLLLAVSVFIVIGWLQWHRQSRPQNAIELYWMPYCPYGIQAVQKLLKLSDTEKVEVHYHYIAIDKLIDNSHLGKNNASSGLAGCDSFATTLPIGNYTEGRFYSLHGKAEVEEGVRQVIISKEYSKQWRSYLQRFVENPSEDWQERCRQVAVPVEKINQLVQSKQGEKWYAEDLRYARGKGITRSPSIVIGEITHPFPEGYDKLRISVCSSIRCASLSCSTSSTCPQRQGLVANCDKDSYCTYEPASLRQDAVHAFLIYPKDCSACRLLPVSNILKDWVSYFRVEQIDLESHAAQDALRGAKVTTFPVLAVSDDISQRPWGARCINELSLVAQSQNFLVAINWSAVPFISYAKIHTDDAGTHVQVDCYAEAVALHQANLREEATRMYKLALVENPQDYRAWNNLGALTYDVQGMKNLGGAMFQRAVDIDSSYEPAVENLYKYASEKNQSRAKCLSADKLGWIAVRNKQWGRALVLFKEALPEKSVEFSARKGLADVAIQQGQFEEALVELEKSLQLNHNPDSDFANLLGGVYFRMGNNEYAMSWYLYALQGDNPSSNTRNNVCFLLSSTKQWEKLLQFTGDALTKAPSDIDLYFSRAEALVQLSRYTEAIECLNGLTTESPDVQCRLCYELATLYGKCYDREACISHIQQFLKIVAQQEQPTLDEQCRVMAELAIKYEDYPLALQALVQTVQIKPSDVTAHKLLAHCYECMGQPEKYIQELLLAKQFGGDMQ